MNVISQTETFADWLGGLADAVGKGLIVARIEAARLGNFGDCEPVGEGVSEMRVHFGPGYRVYFMREGHVLYLLLCGGDKSTQKADIRRAREMARQWKQAAKAEARTGGGITGLKAKPRGKGKAPAKLRVKPGLRRKPGKDD